MRVAHFVQRYPPAIGGSESFFARLSRHLAAAGDEVTVFTTNALDLEAFWKASGASVPSGTIEEDGVEVRRYGLVRWPGRKYVLKPLSLIPNRMWQCLTLPCNPIAPSMWREAGKGNPRFESRARHGISLRMAHRLWLATGKATGNPVFVNAFSAPGRR